MTTVHRQLTAADLPAETRRGILYLAEVEGTRLDPPMLIEGAGAMTDLLAEGMGTSIMLSVWPANPRQHRMHGILLDPDAPVVVSNDPA